MAVILKKQLTTRKTFPIYFNRIKIAHRDYENHIIGLLSYSFSASI